MLTKDESKILKIRFTKLIRASLKKGVISSEQLISCNNVEFILKNYVEKNYEILEKIDYSELFDIFEERVSKVNEFFNSIYILKKELIGDVTEKQLYKFNKLNKIINEQFESISIEAARKSFDRNSIAIEINELNSLVVNEDNLNYIYSRATEKQIKYLNKLIKKQIGTVNAFGLNELSKNEADLLINKYMQE